VRTGTSGTILEFVQLERIDAEMGLKQNSDSGSQIIFIFPCRCANRGWSSGRCVGRRLR